jgi:hypothetical protein
VVSSKFASEEYATSSGALAFELVLVFVLVLVLVLAMVQR